MATRDELLADRRLEHADGKPDYENGITSKVIRCVFEGQRAVAVSGDESPKTQIAALLDLLDLHLQGKDRYKDVAVRPDEVTLLLGGRRKGSREAVDAVRTLVRTMREGPRVRLLEHDGASGWRPVADEPFDLRDVANYPEWPRLLDEVPTEPPKLVISFVRAVGLEPLRAYPMLSSHGKQWSVRLEGLEVGRFTKKAGWLDV